MLKPYWPQKKPKGKKAKQTEQSEETPAEGEGA